jgi:predicted Zn-dependent protease
MLETAKMVIQQAFAQRTIGSFDDLTDRRALEVQPKRLRVVRADRTMSLEQFAREQHATVELETLALINQMPDGGGVQRGERYKLVVGGELP